MVSIFVASLNSHQYKYIKALREITLDAKEEFEKKTVEEQLQKSKITGIWATRKLKIEQQIAPKQSPMQRTRRIRSKREEEINRIRGNNANGGTEHKSRKKRLSTCRSAGELEIRWVKSSVALPEEGASRSSKICLPKLPEMHTRKLPTLSSSTPATSSCHSKSSSLPTISKQLPAKVFYASRSSEISLPKLPEMHTRKLPTLSCSTPATLMSCNNKSPSLPTINNQLPAKVFCVRSQPLSHLKLPPLKL